MVLQGQTNIGYNYNFCFHLGLTLHSHNSCSSLRKRKCHVLSDLFYFSGDIRFEHKNQENERIRISLRLRIALNILGEPVMSLLRIRPEALELMTLGDKLKT